MDGRVGEHGDESWNCEDLLLLGAGSVALAVAQCLVGSTEFRGEVRVWGRSEDSLLRFQSLGVKTTTDLEAGLHDVGTAVLCVSDGALENVASALAKAQQFGAESEPKEERHRPPLVVLHTSGFRGVDALGALSSTGAELGVMHPMAALAGSAAVASCGTRQFFGVTFGVSGSPVARQRAAGVAELLGGRTVLVKDELRGLYHGAAALLSGGLVALFAEAEACLVESIGIADATSDGGGQNSQEEARRILRGLLASTTGNLLDLPPERALTGPVARGDSAVVEGHARAFAGRPSPRTGELHKLLTQIMGELVAKRHRREP